jgi:PAS domain S-box-containing protein
MPDALEILLVEDNPTDALLVQAQLALISTPPLHVHSVTTLAEATQRLTSHTFDAVLLDLSLPDGEGLESLVRVREASPGVAVVVLTGLQDEGLAMRVVQAGAQDYVAKGRIDGQVLARILRFAIERNRLQQQIVRQARLRDAMFDAMSDLGEGLAVTDSATGRFLYVSDSLAHMFGYTPEEMLALATLDLAGDEVRESLIDRHRQRMAGVPLPQCFEFAGRHKSGARIDVDVSIRVIHDEPAPVPIVAVYRDVTELKRAQARLLLADRMVSVGTLASGVAHEINNPLAYVVGNLGIMAEELADLQREVTPGRLHDLEACLKDTQDGAERVRRIVRDLKAFSRVDEDRREVLDVRDAIEAAVHLAWNEVRHRARLVRDFASVPMVEANESRLAQVFVNLLINAAQAIPEGHVDQHDITIRTLQDGHARVVIEVQDTGAGMAPDVLARVFDPFFTTKPVGVGTGLGLSICHGIIAALGGTIEVESQPGHGTLVRITLKPAEVRKEPEREVQVPIAPGRRGRVLVIDDEPMVGAMVRRLLGHEHDVEVLTDGHAALGELLSDGARFDVVLCDMMMPTMTGMELHAQLASRAPEVAKRVVFLTGGAFTPAAQDFLTTVRPPFVEKPFDTEKLRRLVRERVGEATKLP